MESALPCVKTLARTQSETFTKTGTDAACNYAPSMPAIEDQLWKQAAEILKCVIFALNVKLMGAALNPK